MKTESNLTIQKAYHLLNESAARYTPKNDACWVCYENTDGRSETFEDMNDFTYCEDCIQKVLEKASQEHTNDLPEDFVKFDFQVESMCEKDDFLHCDECGELIRCSSLFSKQEIDHWTTLSKRQWIETLQVPYSCFELKIMLQDTHGIVGKYPVAALRIAMKVLKHYSTN